uniref:Uncharacterized protein n=1 Tax=Panagrolaimus sp. JU765 TaxID=591449 RepID=A0AC34PVS1_9BILA
VLRYRAERWRKKTDVNFDAVEFKFILSMDPALKHAVESLINPEQPVVHIPSDMSNDSINMKSNGGKTNFEQVEYEEYRDDDFDQDFSDEDDWDNKKKKRKRAKDMSFKQNYSRKSFPGPSSSNTPSSASTSDDRPFGCN